MTYRTHQLFLSSLPLNPHPEEGQREVTYLRKIFPRAKRRKTTRRSELCILCQKWFRGPSISKGVGPKWGIAKHQNPNWQILKKILSSLLNTSPQSLNPHSSSLDTYISFSDIIRVFINIPGQAEVTDLNHVLL